jgi:hypothetical protein
MKIEKFRLCRGVVASASLLVMSCVAVTAQTPAVQTTVAQVAQVPARVSQAADDQRLVALKGNVHPLARPEFDRGPVSDSQLANRMVLVLKRSQEQEAALRQLLDDQQSKSSPNYHTWLTPQQFAKQFGPADSDIQAITDWLTSHGFNGIKVGAGRTTIEFSGNIGQVRNAFHTDIHHFQVNGEAHMAAISDPQIPAALAPVIAGVMALHDFRPKAQIHRLGTFRKVKDTGEVKPLFTFTGCGSGGTSPCYAVGPGDFAKIYNVPSSMTGAGVTIAIVQDSNLNVQDVVDYRTIFGLSNNFSSSNIILNGPDPGIQGPNSATDDEIEADLDVELSGGVATGATIDLVVSEDSQSVGTSGVDLSAIYVIDNNLAPILSESFGACETNITSSGEQFYNALWEQASAQGITVSVAAGDTGAAGCDPLSGAANQDVATQGIAVSGQASTAFNVAVGGTDFQNFLNGTPSTFWNAAGAATESAKSYIPESTWNNSCAGTATSANLNTCTSAIISKDESDPSDPDITGGSGGPSAFNPKPTWQSGTNGNPSDSARDLPDISFFAGNGFNSSFYIVCNMDSNTGTGSSTSSCNLSSPFNDFQGVGGTSAGAPAFAAVMALINQKTGQRQGNANFVLYQLYKKNTAGTICPSNAASVTTATCIFYDTITGNNTVACMGGTPNCSNTTSGSNQFGVIVEPGTTTPAWPTTTGYDLATGLGSLNVGNLINAWSSATFSGDTVAITSPASGTVNVKHGTNVAFTVKVTQSSGSTVPTGAVSLVAEPSGSPQLGIGSFSQNTNTMLSSGGSVTITTNELPGSPVVGGTPQAYPVVATYAGDGTFAPGTSAPVTVTVMPEASKTTVNLLTFSGSTGTNATTAPYGSSYILEIAVSDNAGNQCASVVVACPTGTVTLTDNGSPLKDFSGGNTAKLNSQGIAEDQPVQLGVGNHSLVAAYAGDNSFSASTSAADAISITQAATSTTATSSAGTVAVNQQVTLTANIATQSSGVGPTGMVTFSAGGKSIGTATVTPTNANPNSASPINASGTASLNTTFTSSGAQSVTVAYSGDTNYSASTSSAITVTVTVGSQATTTTASASSTSITSGASVTLTAKVSGANNNGPGPTGTVQFMNGTTALGSPATCTPTAGTSTTPGTCTATLMTTLSHLPPPPTTPTRQLPSFPAAPLSMLAAILLIAFVVTAKRLRLPKRLVYASVGLLLFVCVAAGIAGCGGGSSSSGGGGGGTHTDSITAVYSGDANYAGSTSTAVSITVTQ